MALLRMLRPLSLAALLCAPAFPGSIAGRIVNSITQAGIAGAAVTVWNDATFYDGAIASATGEYKVAAVADGQYTILVTADGYIFAATGPARATVSVSGDVRRDIQLTPLAKLQGKVVDSDGNPLAGVRVELAPLGKQAVTDATGAFALEKLGPGALILLALPRSQDADKDGNRMVITYYPSVANRSQAVPIRMNGVDQSGFEIRMQTGPARRVRGRILDQEGDPLPGARLVLYRPLEGRLTSVPGIPQLAPPQGPEVTGRDDGAFELPAVPEGDWILQARATHRDTVRHADTELGGSTELHVGRDDIEGLEMRLGRQIELRLTADWGDSPPEEPPLTLPMIQLIDAQLGTGGPSRRVDAELVVVFPGRYLVAPSSAIRGYYLSAITLQHQNVLGQVVDLSGADEFTLVYKKGGGSIRGTVTNAARGAEVLVLTATTALAQYGWSVPCDAKGEFTISGLPPGGYTLVGINSRNALTDPGLEPLIASGERVNVEDGGVASVEIRAK